MNLTEQQKATLKTFVQSDPVLGQLTSSAESAVTIANALNAAASPAFTVWKTNVSADAWAQAVLEGGGSTQLDALTGSKRDSLLWAISRPLNPSVANVRLGLDDFCGGQNTLKAALAAVEKRTSNVVEKVLSSGTGSNAVPATLGAGAEGSISYNEVGDVMDWAF